MPAQKILVIDDEEALIFVVKVMGANLVRLYLRWQAGKNKVEGSALHG